MKKNTVFQAILAIAVLVSAAPALAANISTKILNDGSTLALSNPAVAEDSNGRIHIVAQGWAVANLGGVNELYYMMVEKDGDVRIAATLINTPDANTEGRPDIVVLSNDKVVVTWAKSGEAVRYVLINPALDDQNGDAAVPATILERTETAIGVDTNRGHLDAAVDSTDIVHVVKAATTGGLRYNSWNPATNAVVTADVQIDANTANRVRPAIGIDSNDDLHIAYCSNTVGAGNCPATYMMLNGANGAVLIDSTQLFNTVEAKAAHISLAVDSNDRVHITYGDKRNNVDADNYCNECYQGGTAIYTKLDPSGDDQSGDAATLANIQFYEEEMGNLWYARGFMSGGSMRLIGANGKGGALTYIGSPGSLKTYNTNIGGNGWSRHYVDSVGGKVFWGEGVYSPTLTGGTLQLVMANMSSFSGGGGGGSPGLPLLLVFGLVGLARLRRR